MDRVGAVRLLHYYLLPLAAGLAVLALSAHPLAAPLFMALAGVTSGLAGSVIGSAWAEVYGVRHLGAIRALGTALMVFGTAGSPVAMGWLIDAGVSMATIAAACAAGAVAASMLAAVALRGERSAEAATA